MQNIQNKIIKNVYQLQQQSESCPINALIEHTSNQTLKKTLPKLSILAVQVVSFIAQNDNCRSVDLANHFKVTRGAISKIMHKLIENELVNKHKTSCNQKEKLFCVTAKGQALANLYDKEFMSLTAQQHAFMEQFNTDELKTINRFLEGFYKINLK